jgi:Bacterial Ig-like domain (group 3)
VKFRIPGGRKLGLFAGLLATLGVVAVALVSFALATTFNPGGVYAPLGGNTLNQQLPISNTSLTPDCSESANPPEIGFDPASGGVLWHFILTSPAQTSGLLRADFDTAGLTVPDVPDTPHQSGTLHWFVITPSADTLLNASSNVLGGNLNLSHVCYQQKTQPTVRTTLHAPDHAAIANGSALDLGSTVHDSATVSGGGATPTGTVTFTFYSAADCGGEGVGAGTVPLDNGVADPSDAKGPLGPGSYGFKASYSGDPNYLTGASDCEPFSVKKGQLSATTKLHDPNDAVIPNGTELDLGSVVHDTAKITGQVAGFDPDNAVTFAFYSAADCGGDPVAKDNIGADAGSGDPRSAATSALTPGSYGFKASIAGDNNYEGSTSDCEPFSVKKGQLSATTKLHDPNDAVIPNGTELDLGSVVHDTAKITGQVAGFDPDNAVTFAFYSAADCGGDPVAKDNIGADAGSGDPRSAATSALTPGSYGFKASIAGDNNYEGSTSDCEPFSVKKANLGLRTDIHNAAHQVVTFVTVNSVVHDTATLSNVVTGFNPNLADITFKFWTNGTCAGDVYSSPAQGTPESALVARTVDSAQLASGAYSYKAHYAGDTNYNEADFACEPLSVRTFGKTMGFWGNPNGQARIIAAGGYAANAVNIGRGSNIDTQTESLKVLPNQLNACGKGMPQIFSVGGSTNTLDCLFNTGINKGSLNTLAAQTLALGYNLKPALLPGFAGQTLGALPCTGVNGLTPTSTAGDAFTTAVGLINGSYLGATTQSQIGLMNTLLACINAEAT